MQRHRVLANCHARNQVCHQEIKSNAETPQEIRFVTLPNAIKPTTGPKKWPRRARLAKVAASASASEYSPARLSAKGGRDPQNAFFRRDGLGPLQLPESQASRAVGAVLRQMQALKSLAGNTRSCAVMHRNFGSSTSKLEL